MGLHDALKPRREPEPNNRDFPWDLPLTPYTASEARRDLDRYIALVRENRARAATVRAEQEVNEPNDWYTRYQLGRSLPPETQWYDTRNTQSWQDPLSVPHPPIRLQSYPPAYMFGPDDDDEEE